jgi:hypothetical protein
MCVKGQRQRHSPHIDTRSTANGRGESEKNGGVREESGKVREESGKSPARVRRESGEGSCVSTMGVRVYNP